jgi:hypothetical protein
MQGLISQPTLWAVLIGFDVLMLAWLLSEVSDFRLVATIWLVGLGTWAVIWKVTRPTGGANSPSRRSRPRR